MSVLDSGLTLFVNHSSILDDQRMNHGFPEDALGVLYEKKNERLRDVPPTEAIFER